MEPTTTTPQQTNGAGPTTAALESFNPTTGELIGSVPTLTPEQVQSVVDEVAAVQPFWAQLPLSDRARYMRRAAQVIIDSLDEITALLSREQGKPRNESYVMELIPTIDTLHWIADHGPEILADERIRDVPIFAKQKRHFFSYEPLGVVGVIAPWNYPWSIPFGEVAIALMCGNGVVLKPASLTPLIGDRIMQVFQRAGLPEGIVRTVHGGGKVGNALVESTASKIFFTGSVEIGRRVGVACAERLKGSVLELGGKDSQLVLEDANLPNAIAGCLWGGFANAGQTCSGIERVYVMREVADRFVAGVVEGARALKVGDPMEWDTEIGPMVSEEQYEIVRELVDDAVANGATMHCGGPVDVPGYDSGTFYGPTILTDVRPDMRIMREEIFGPVIPIVTVDSEDEAIALANDSEFGLGTSVWTLDREKGQRIARRIETGMVWINDHMYSHGVCACAWGGVKDSGIGRAHSKFGFYECVNVKQVAWEPSRLRNFWWHPYDESMGRGLHAAAQLLYGRDDDKRDALVKNVGPLLHLGRKSLRGAIRR
ncbi:MAG TPA: aldehyde dehydrogenase family protein [Thermoleophilaceae bacterium]|nr:aldehyde dehydrogenase family protein [Thermoleophilaceae bacterium]